jgi:hypothetical protein
MGLFFSREVVMEILGRKGAKAKDNDDEEEEEEEEQ